MGRINNPSALPWQQTNESIDVSPPPLPFTRSSNSTITLPVTVTPTEFFDHFMDEDRLSLVLDETNRQVYIVYTNQIHALVIHRIFVSHRYAEGKISTLEAQGKLRRRSRLAKWTAVTLSELLGFIAIILNMGLIHVPELEDYWRVSWVSEIPCFSPILSRDRFEPIF